MRAFSAASTTPSDLSPTCSSPTARKCRTGPPRACRPDISSNEQHRVKVLLDYGANVDDRGRYGLTALHYAVRGGKLPLIKLLLENVPKPTRLIRTA